MKHISILIPNGNYSVVNIMGSYQILSTANEMYRSQHGKDLFQIDLLGFNDKAQTKAGSAYVNATKYWNEISSTDIIIIPAIHDEPEVCIGMNDTLIEFLKDYYKKGSNIASLCVGAYLLGGTGLLNGRVCSTHWMHAVQLRKMFPEIIVKEDRFITDQHGIITSGGAYAFTNLILYLVEKFASRELAIMLSKTFMIDINRAHQSVYATFRSNKQHDDDSIKSVQSYIEENIKQKFNISELAQQSNMTRRTLERRFKSATGISIIDFTQKLRVEQAKIELERSRKTVSEIMFDTGYNDSKAFREVFKKHVGISPLEYRQKFKGL